MAYSFGDSFDLYAAPADMVNGFWDSGPNGNLTFAAGRFAGSQAVRFATTTSTTLVKTSGVNDAVHHLVMAFQQTQAISGSTLGVAFQFFDGATAQCSVVFRSDGAIVLTSGGPGGTTLATYTGAFSTINVWYAFEFEVTINNTTGSFTVRKNGNSVADFTATALDTQQSANAYANKLQIFEQATISAQNIDDLFWQSGAATGAWLGDIRCYARMPASDQSVTFSRTPSNIFAQANPGGTNVAIGTGGGNIMTVAITAPTSGILASLAFNFGSALTGHANMAIYDANGSGGGPGALLAQSASVTNPGAGLNTFAVASGPALQRGVSYWLAIWGDATITAAGNASSSLYFRTLTYTTTFPSPFTPTSGPTSGAGLGSAGVNVTPFNNGVVSEAQQDGLTSYVFDSNPGDADFYGIASIASTPATVIATTVRGYMQKSDAGTRVGAMQLKSGATTVASSSVAQTTSGFQWVFRTDIVDPNTGAAWLPANVNNAQIGPVVIA